MNIKTTLGMAGLLTAIWLGATQAQGPQFRGGRGPDAEFAADREDFQFLLAHHDQIRRQVTEVPSGVETLTESDDERVAERIQKHVGAMYKRMENHQPIRRRDPLFAALFEVADKINIHVEKTPQGVRVVATSDDADAEKLIRAHAKVVSKFVELGFQEARKNHALPPAAASDAAKPDQAAVPASSGDQL